MNQRQKAFEHLHGFALPGAKAHYAPDLVIFPRHMDVSLDVDIIKQKCAVEVVITFLANKKPKVRSIQLNGIGFHNVFVNSVSDHSITYRYDGNILQLHWEDAFEPHEERVAKICYTIVEPVDGLFFQTPDKEYPHKKSYVIAENETEKARYWLPCVDYPAIRTTFDFRLTSLEKYTFVANGKLVGESVKRGKKTSHWKIDFPCPTYLCVFAIGEFISVSDGEVDGMPLCYMALEGTSPKLLKDCFSETPKMIRWLSEKLDSPFPFKDVKYFQIAVPDVSSALECISLVTWNDTWLFDEKLAPERKMWFDLVNVHEIAHSYFGNSIVMRHFEHAWLKESWATYIEAVYLEENVSEDEFRFVLEDQADKYMQESVQKYSRPIVTRIHSSSWDLFDSHIYSGGSWRIHMLRRKLGDDVFWPAVRQYVKKYQNELVETDDFKEILEEESGLNLQPFFDQWIFGMGYPRLKGEFFFDMERNEVKIWAQQAQSENWSSFDVDLLVEITCENEEVFTSTLSFRASRNASTTIKLGDVSTIPIMARIDPHLECLYTLEMNPGEDILGLTVKKAADVNNRIWAGYELIRVGTSSSFAKLDDAMIQEEFYGVRVKIAQKLGETKTVLASKLLAKILHREEDPRALHLIAGACKARDRYLREAILEVLERENLPVMAKANLYLSLGRQRDPDDVPFLIKALKTEDPGFVGIVKSGIYSGLGESGSEEAYEFLKTMLKYGAEMETVRPAAVSAFCQVASKLDKHIQSDAADIVADILSDPDWKVRDSAIDGLVCLKAKSKLDHLEDMKKVLAEQHHPWLERQLQELRMGDNDPTTVQLRKDIESLELKVKYLQERIRVLENK